MFIQELICWLVLNSYVSIFAYLTDRKIIFLDAFYFSLEL